MDLTKTYAAAEAGDASAQRFLGLLCFLGQEIPKDYIESYKWLKLAALQGEETAKVVLEYLSKMMTPEELAEAERRFEIAGNERKSKRQ